MTRSTIWSMNKRANGSIKLWAVAAWLVLWQLAAAAVGQEILLVSPADVLMRLITLLPEADFWARIGYSSLRIFLGLALGMTIGALLGALAAKFAWVGQLFAPLIAVVRAIPVASFIIVALIWISSKNLSVFISFLICFPVFYTNVFNGMRAADVKLLEMADVFGLSEYKRMRYIMLPSVYPYFRAGASVAIGLTWKSGIAAELIAQTGGSIGEKLYYAKAYLLTADMFAWTFTIVMLSAAFELAASILLRVMGRRLEGG